jgi:alkylated DNA nucleotide flippase Atl1
MSVEADEYAAAVLELVARIPPGRAMTYGLIAEVIAERLRRGGPRQVGQVLAGSGGAVPWWRVVNAAGAPPAPYAHEALDRLRAEGAPLTADGTRVALRRAVWWPEQD